MNEALRARGRAPPSHTRPPGARGPWTPWIVLAIAVLIALVISNLPPRWNPFAPIDLGKPPDIFTRYKLARLEGDPEACFAALKTSSVQHDRIPDRPIEDGCGIVTATRVTRSDLVFNNRFTATCPLVAAWAMFETNALQPAAQRHFGKAVTRVIHGGTYSCRNINGRKTRTPSRSQHALGNAIDILEFALADGTTISVAKDWKNGVSKAFLEDIHAGACRYFRGVLGPDFNAAHADHFHFDRGPFHICR